MALITHPKLLLLDEPYGPLDPYSHGQLVEKIHALVKAEIIVVLSTHVLPDNHPPDRAVVLEQGAVIQDLALDAHPEQVWNQFPHRLLQGSLSAVRNPLDA